MIELTQNPNPPRHLVLGSWGYDAVVADRKARLKQIEDFKAVSVGADFPKDGV